VIARCARGRPGVQDHNGCWIRSSKYAPAQLIVSLLANLLGRSASTIFHLIRNYAVLDFGVRSGWNHFPAEKLSLVLIGPVLHDCGRVHIADSGQGLQFGFAGAIYTTSGDASGADAFCAVLAVGGVLLPSEVWAGTEPVSAKRLRRIAIRRANFMTTIIKPSAQGGCFSLEAHFHSIRSGTALAKWIVCLSHFRRAARLRPLSPRVDKAWASTRGYRLARRQAECIPRSSPGSR
jgi:hypothetical protein